MSDLKTKLTVNALRRGLDVTGNPDIDVVEVVMTELDRLLEMESGVKDVIAECENSHPDVTTRRLYGKLKEAADANVRR